MDLDVVMKTMIKNTRFSYFFLMLLCLSMFGVSAYSEDESVDFSSSGQQSSLESEKEEEGYLINFPNVNIIEYIRFISQITNKNFIFKETDLQFKVTILSEEATSIDNILAALVQILRIHNLSLLEQGNNLIIHRNPQMAQVPKVVTSTDGESGIITQVFQLKNVNPEAVLQILKPMVSRDSIVDVSKETRHLIVTDVARNIEQIASLLESLDAPNVSIDIGYYTAEFARLDLLIDLAYKILAPIADENPLVLVPHGTSKTIYVVSTPYLIDRTISVLKTLDIEDKTLPALQEDSLVTTEVFPEGHVDNTNFYIHKLQYHKGESLVESIHNMGTTLNDKSSANESLISTIQSTQWIESSNSLLFTGDKASLRKVRELVEGLDMPVKQVLIEMLVVETTIANALEFGVEWGISSNESNSSFAVSNLSTASTGTNPLISALSSNPPTALNTIGSQGFNFGVIGSSITQGGTTFHSLGALVKALQSDKDTNILLNPKILTQDGSEALIFIGGTSAFQSSQSVNDQGNIVTVNVEYKDLGTELKVTPFLGPDDVVTLEIEQEISEDTTGSGGIQTGTTNTVQIGPVSSKSITKTKVHVPNDDFLIISGMIREKSSKSTNKIPCLGSVPYVGESLFGNRADSVLKTNLMIFLRPHIISSDADIVRISEKQKKIFESKAVRGNFLESMQQLLTE